MIEVKRIRHATFATPDIEAQIEYYQSIIGLGVVGKQDGRAYLATNPEELTLVLEKEGVAGCKAMAFELAPNTDLRDLCRRLEDSGIKSHMRSDSLPGISEMLVFKDLDGRQIELLRSGNLPGPAAGAGDSRNKLGHMALYAPDPDLTAKFYEEVLGCRISDRIEQNFVFMRSGIDHHSLNFARGPDARLHHMAFELRDASHMQQACDLWPQENRPSVGAGASWSRAQHRHLSSQSRRIPGRAVLRHGSNGRRRAWLFEPRPWHRDRPQRPKTWVGLPRDIWGAGRLLVPLNSRQRCEVRRERDGRLSRLSANKQEIEMGRNEYVWNFMESALARPCPAATVNDAGRLARDLRGTRRR